MDEALLVDEYRSRVLYFILRQVRERAAAEELTQETLLILIHGLRENRVRDDCKIGPYIFGIARNLIVRYRSSLPEKDSSLVSESTPQPWISDPEVELLLEEERALS